MTVAKKMFIIPEKTNSINNFIQNRSDVLTYTDKKGF